MAQQSSSNPTTSSAIAQSGQPSANGKSSDTPQNSLLETAKSKIDQFCYTLTEVFNDITALEVNTMVVSDITGAKFSPEEEYRKFYELRQEMPSVFPNPDDPKSPENRKFQILQNFESMAQDCMKNLNISYEETPSSGANPGQPLPLPPPGSDAGKKLLSDGEFRRNFRKIVELYYLAKGNQTNNSEPDIKDIIYAQTVIQLDGDIINRFHEQLLNDEKLTLSNKEFLLKVHNDAVQSGETNWRGLLKFMFELVQELVSHRAGN